MATVDITSRAVKPFGQVFARRTRTSVRATHLARSDRSPPIRSNSFLFKLGKRLPFLKLATGESAPNIEILQDDGRIDEETQGSPSSVAENSDNRPYTNNSIALFQEAKNVKLSGSASINVFSSTLVTPMVTDNALSGVTLVDATGKMFSIPMPLAISYKTFMSIVIRILNENHRLESRVQREFIAKDMYDLCMDLGYGVLTISDQLDWDVQPGSKIVLRIVLWQEKHEFLKYLCPRFICETWNMNLHPFSVKSIDCRGCDARFQVSDVDHTELKTSKVKNIGAFGYQTKELASIKNMHLRWQSRRGPTPRMGMVFFAYD
ncbi:hypothetical protein CPB83DRAFT_99685 [Crepidotus variabilis]|uniref:Uncharacterized protein n=1 Tax=Crepidotus variabilis TaxID=179855 RepID=A0A9P6EMJ1_9AGAR|nr:hypothetical protein CPB83DRAFT_99685 [Crepidotus variabilis]